MIPTALNILLGMAVVILAWLLVRKRHEEEALSEERSEGDCGKFWQASWLRVAERIFDVADFHWLRDEIAQPQLARALARARKQIALEWLKAVRLSFDRLVRTPGPSEPVPHLLWMSLRIRMRLGYATLVVRLFGPYHRLIWSFDFLPSFTEPAPGRPRHEEVD